MHLSEAAVYILKCYQLFMAIVAQEHKPSNMAAGGYVMSPKSPVHLSMDLPELSLVFQRPRCFLVSPSCPGGNLVILSDSLWLRVCHDNCTHSGDKRAWNNMPQLYHFHMCVCVCVCEKEVRGASVYRNAKVSAFSGYPSAAIPLAPHHGCPAICMYVRTLTHT